MAGFDPLHALRKRLIRVGPNRHGLPHGETRNGQKRGHHRRRRLADGHHVQRPSRQDLCEGVIGQGPLDNTSGADRVHSGADDREQVFFESGERRCQWTLHGSDQPDRPVTTSNSRSNSDTT